MAYFISTIPAWVWLTSLIIGLLVAPFFAWRTTYKAKLQAEEAKLQAEKERDELKSEDAELQRERTKLYIKQLQDERPMIGSDDWPRAI